MLVFMEFTIVLTKSTYFGEFHKKLTPTRPDPQEREEGPTSDQMRGGIRTGSSLPAIAAAARRPVNTHPPRKVPSRERLP